MMYFTSTPRIIRKLFSPELIWDIPNEKNMVFLTFDDGPHPEVTPAVLDVLEQKNINATFFCVGDNVSKYPATYHEIVNAGHKTGNHTFNHLNGWKTSTEKYIENISECSKWVDSDLFRPPYGRIRNKQIGHLKDLFKIIMWTVLSVDYDKKVSGKHCFENVVKHTKSGSIIVFHDSLKAKQNLLYALPHVIDELKENGFTFGLIK